MKGNPETLADAPKVYDVDDVIQIIGVCRRTVYRYVKSGKLKATKIGKRYIVTDENLRKFLNGES